ncbi:MAG: hypothetical protein ACP5PC_07535 [bacterium]
MIALLLILFASFITIQVYRTGKATLAFKAVKTTIPPKVIEVKDI